MTEFQNGNLRVDLLQAHVFIDKQRVFVTMREFQVLLAFMQNIGKRMPHEYFHENLGITTVNLRTSVYRLRAKIGHSAILGGNKKEIGYVMPYIPLPAGEENK